MSTPYPNLEDVRFRHDMLTDCRLITMSPLAMRSALCLVRFVAGGLVQTYSDPTDGSLPENDTRLSRICGISEEEWLEIKPEVLEIFRRENGRLYLVPDWVEVRRPKNLRPSISPVLRMSILRRDGFQCGYCGTSNGPFDIDHMVPISRGGAHDAENFITACCRCNRAKSDKMLAEWLA